MPLVIWGNRFRKDFFDLPINQNINLIKSVSRDEKDATTLEGYVQDIVLSHFEDIIACGSEKMITAAKLKFLKHGVSLRNFTSDTFYAS